MFEGAFSAEKTGTVTSFNPFDSGQYLSSMRRVITYHADTQQNTADQKLRPRLRQSLSDGSEQTEDTAYKDCATTANQVIDGIGQPACTAITVS